MVATAFVVVHSYLDQLVRNGGLAARTTTHYTGKAAIVVTQRIARLVEARYCAS